VKKDFKKSQSNVSGNLKRRFASKGSPGTRESLVKTCGGDLKREEKRLRLSDRVPKRKNPSEKQGDKKDTRNLNSPDGRGTTVR